MQRAFNRFEGVVEASVTGAGDVEQRLLRLCDQTFSLIVEEIQVVRLMYSIYYGLPREPPSSTLMPFIRDSLKPLRDS